MEDGRGETGEEGGRGGEEGRMEGSRGVSEGERERRVGVVASPLDCYWFSVSLRVHQLFLSISCTSFLPMPPTRTHLAQTPSSHSPSLHHIPPLLPIYFAICQPVSHPYIPDALSRSVHISSLSLPRPIGPPSPLPHSCSSLSLSALPLNTSFLQSSLWKRRRRWSSRKVGRMDEQIKECGGGGETQTCERAGILHYLRFGEVESHVRALVPVYKISLPTWKKIKKSHHTALHTLTWGGAGTGSIRAAFTLLLMLLRKKKCWDI